MSKQADFIIKNKIKQELLKRSKGEVKEEELDDLTKAIVNDPEYLEQVKDLEKDFPLPDITEQDVADKLITEEQFKRFNIGKRLIKAEENNEELDLKELIPREYFIDFSDVKDAEIDDDKAYEAAASQLHLEAYMIAASYTQAKETVKFEEMKSNYSASGLLDEYFTKANNQFGFNPDTMEIEEAELTEEEKSDPNKIPMEKRKEIRNIYKESLTLEPIKEVLRNPAFYNKLRKRCSSDVRFKRETGLVNTFIQHYITNAPYSSKNGTNTCVGLLLSNYNSFIKGNEELEDFDAANNNCLTKYIIVALADVVKNKRLHSIDPFLIYLINIHINMSACLPIEELTGSSKIIYTAFKECFDIALPNILKK